MIEREAPLPTAIFSDEQVGRLKFVRWMAFNSRLGRIPEGRAAGIVAMTLVMEKRLPIEMVLRENPKPRAPQSDFEQTN